MSKQELIDALIYEGISSSAQAILKVHLDGMEIVPEEPTVEMLSAVKSSYRHPSDYFEGEVYANWMLMLAIAREEK